MCEENSAGAPRSAGCDLFRVCCTVAVVVLHISASYYNWYMHTNERNIFLLMPSVMGNSITRFAVPGFLMLTGAFTLRNRENREWNKYYIKIFKRIGAHAVIFSILYLLYDEVFAVETLMKHRGAPAVLLNPFRKLVSGEPFYHMWYLFMMVGIYVLIPFLIRLKELLGERRFSVVSWIYFLVSVPSGLHDDNDLHWSVTKTAAYLGYVLIGYQIQKAAKPNAAKSAYMISASVLLLLFYSWLAYEYALIGEMMKNITFIPTVVLASVCAFCGFASLPIRRAPFKLICRCSFLIYLIHAGVWDLIYRLIKPYEYHPMYMIPLFSIAVLTVSVLLSILYSKIWEYINLENRAFHAVKRVFKRTKRIISRLPIQR